MRRNSVSTLAMMILIGIVMPLLVTKIAIAQAYHYFDQEQEFFEDWFPPNNNFPEIMHFFDWEDQVHSNPPKLDKLTWRAVNTSANVIDLGG